MTANAMQADRERCFAAGMNDHVPKPIDPDVLWATLVRWLSPRPEAASHSPAPPANAPLAFALALFALRIDFVHTVVQQGRQ